MKEKELIQKAIAESMPDRETVRNRCVARAESAAAASHRIKRIVIPTAVCAAVALTAVCAVLYRDPSMKGIGVGESTAVTSESRVAASGNHTFVSESAAAASPVSESKTAVSAAYTTAPTIRQGNSVAPSNDFVTINELTSQPLAAVSSNICLKVKDFVKMSKQELCGFYGVNVFPAVPQDLTEDAKAVYGIYRRNNGTGDLYYSANGIRYANSSAARTLDVIVDKGKLPHLDIVTYESGKNRPSTINGQEVSVGRYTDGKSVCYYAEFSYHDAGFRVMAEGLTENEFIGVLTSLLR